MQVKLLKVLRFPVCDNCLGRILAAQLLHGFSNAERGKVLRTWAAFLLDAKILKLEAVEPSNFAEFEFRNVKLETKKKECYFCQGFFERINEWVERIKKRISEYEFGSFLVGCKPSVEMLKREEEIFEEVGIEFAESIREEITREIGKRLSKEMKKEFDPKNPEITILVDLENDKISISIKSLFIYGEYKKLVRGIPQAKWICSNCKGKGCVKCKGTGKLYPTSIQEIIEKPLLKLTKGKKSSFHAQGREDIDARCLDWRPFVIEIKKPKLRKIDLKKVEREINKSKKVKVRKLKFVEKQIVKLLKAERRDKTYAVEVVFKRDVDKQRLKLLKSLENKIVEQKTPLRVLHRRTDKLRKRKVLKISWKVLGKRKILFKIRAQAGLYIKELVSGDKGRTKPSIAEILNNEVKSIKLDVVKIH